MCTVVDGSAVCTCKSGYSGTSCASCDTVTHCSGNAWGCRPVSNELAHFDTECITSAGLVDCDEGWEGTMCDTCNADVMCNGRGTCNANEDGDAGLVHSCTCGERWAGEACDTCAAHWFPANQCSLFCKSATTCNGNGACLSNGVCSCGQGWGGATCNSPVEVELTGAQACPSHLPVEVSVKWASRHCRGDCESCTTGGGWMPSGPAPSCSYHDNKTYRLFRGEKCWGGRGTCTATTVVARKCRPRSG